MLPNRAVWAKVTGITNPSYIHIFGFFRVFLLDSSAEEGFRCYGFFFRPFLGAPKHPPPAYHPGHDPASVCRKTPLPRLEQPAAPGTQRPAKVTLSPEGERQRTENDVEFA